RELLTVLAPKAPEDAPEQHMEESKLRAFLATVPLEHLRESGVLDSLLRIAEVSDTGAGGGGNGADDRAEEGIAEDAIDAMDLDHLIQLALEGDDS
ncbi:hypothetical protein, partial [Streptomyces sp. TBY4]|uniref:hypothetical protein n=1 Tax=Streptomyces sp. TBY4 TaxID=2962030 RepID=UPI0020B76021